MEENNENTYIKESQQDEVKAIVPNSKPYLTYAIIAINVAMWLITYAYGKANNVDGNFVLGEKFNPLIMQGELWRLIMPIFLHSQENILHLAVNSYSIYAIGPTIEMIFGRKKFIIIYLLAGVMGNVTSFIFSVNPSVGASGAIFGLLGAMLYLLQKNSGAFKSTFGTTIIIVIVFNLGYGFSNTGIDNFAHLGGLAGGFLAAHGAGFAWERGFNKKKVLIWMAIAALLVGGTFIGFNTEQNKNANILYKVSILLDQASSEFDNKDFKKSEELARQAERLGSKDYNVRSGIFDIIAASMINQGKSSQALEYAKQLVMLDPQRGHYLLGIAYMQTGNTSKAKTELEEAIKNDPDNTQIKGMLDSLGG
jgi:rhomboid protease GluP